MTTRSILRNDLADLKQKVFNLGEKCIEISDLLNTILHTYSDNLQKNASQLADSINKESKELNKRCFMVLSLQQPLIKDLRLVIGSLQIILIIEKIKDYFKAALPLFPTVNQISLPLKEDLSKLILLIQNTLKICITFYISCNPDSTNELKALANQISFTHDLIYKNLLSQETANQENTRTDITQIIEIIRILEKIGDLSINISEQVDYIILGD